jgi:hypothetical protein
MAAFGSSSEKEDVMESTALLDCTGRRRSPATLPGHHRGRPPRNKGLRYPPDPPTVQEIIAVMRAAGSDREGLRLRGLIIVLWRAGLRISEALALAESDLDPGRGAVLVRSGKGGKRREVGMDRWAWERLAPWLAIREALPVGALFCVLHGPTRGRPWAPAGVRVQLRRVAIQAGVRRRFAPHQYADLWVMPIGRGEMPQIAGSAVGKLGITHGHWRPRSMNDRESNRATSGDRSAAGGALSIPAEPCVAVLSGLGAVSPRERRSGTARRAF